MNERIEEFYSQVGLDFENFQRVTVKKGDMEKFAELIVRECAEIALTEAQSNGNFDTFNKMVKHFGVDV
jgi:hypothetical protein